MLQTLLQISSSNAPSMEYLHLSPLSPGSTTAAKRKSPYTACDQCRKSKTKCEQNPSNPNCCMRCEFRKTTCTNSTLAPKHTQLTTRKRTRSDEFDLNSLTPPPDYGVTNDLPPFMLAQTLLRLFFGHKLRMNLPALHPMTFIRQLRDGVVSRPLLLSVLAVAAIQSSLTGVNYTRDDRKLALDLAEKARFELAIGDDRVSVDTIQAYFHLFLASVFRGDGIRAYMAVSAACRGCHLLGLDSKGRLLNISPYQQPHRYLKSESLKRLWWSCMIIDGMLTVTTEMPPHFDPKEVDVEDIPTDYSQWLTYSEDPMLAEMRHPINGTLLSREALIMHAQALQDTLGGLRASPPVEPVYALALLIKILLILVPLTMKVREYKKSLFNPSKRFEVDPAEMNALGVRLAEWTKGYMQFLQSNGANPTELTFLSSYYSMAIMLLNRLSLEPQLSSASSSLDSLSDEQAEAFICCISAAISCAEISWKMNSSRGGVVDFPGISFCHFTAARMLLMGLQNGRQFLSNEYVTKCAIALEQCRTLLRESGKKWNMIRLQSEALEDTISSIRPTLPDGVCALWTLAESTANTVPANVYPININ